MHHDEVDWHDAFHQAGSRMHERERLLAQAARDAVRDARTRRWGRGGNDDEDGDDGSGGVREPRRPLPPTPGLSAAAPGD